MVAIHASTAEFREDVALGKEFGSASILRVHSSL